MIGLRVAPGRIIHSL